MSTCHNCGLPEGTSSNPGREIEITVKPENSFQRPRKVKVWCHSAECALQALAIAKYGAATFRWPITLAQFRALTDLDSPGSKRPPQTENRPPRMTRAAH